MKKHLFFVCPTDFLESTISKQFKGENYFITSLGNSIKFDTDFLDQLKVLLSSQEISEITFLLSLDNSIVKDAMGDQRLLAITGLFQYYFQLEDQHEETKNYWQQGDQKSFIISYYLNKKIQELKVCLASKSSFDINGKIYNKQMGTFNEIYSNLIFPEFASLN